MDPLSQAEATAAQAPQLRPAVFLDRDGTLNKEAVYLYRVEEFAWIPGAPEAVRRLNEADVLVLVVTNQAGIARGYYTEADVRRLHDHMQTALRRYGAHIDAFYFCPDHPDSPLPAYRRDGGCRKPAPGMLREALREWPIDLTRSFLVGDKNIDIEAGRALGLNTLLVETGYGHLHKADTLADAVVTDLPAAVARILERLDQGQKFHHM